MASFKFILFEYFRPVFRFHMLVEVFEAGYLFVNITGIFTKVMYEIRIKSSDPPNE